MTPEIVALLNLFSALKDGGPWLAVFLLVIGGAMAVKSGQLVLKREYDRLEKDLADAEKNADEWRDLYLEAVRMARSAVDMAATRVNK